VNSHIPVDDLIYKAYDIMITVFNTTPNPNLNLDMESSGIKKAITLSSVEHVKKFAQMDEWMRNPTTKNIAEQAMNASKSSLIFEFQS
jgi:hypothetical protein